MGGIQSIKKNRRKQDAIIMGYATDALKLAEKLKNKYQQGLSIYTLAALNRRDGKFAEALKKYFAVLKISEDIGDKICAGNQYMNIGDMYSTQGNVADAIENHLKAVSIFKETGDKFWLLNGYNRIGNIYSGAGNNDEASKYFLLGLNIAKEINNQEQIAAGYLNFATISKNKGDLNEALNYYATALKIYQTNKITCPDCFYNIYLGMGWAHFGLAFLKKTSAIKENYLEALQNFQNALAVAKQTRSRWYLNDAYSGLAKTYEALSDYENALKYTVLQHQAKDSVFTKEAIDKIAKVKMEYENQKTQIEQKAHEQVIIAREKAIRDKLLNEERMRQQIALADEKTLHEKEIAQQKIEQEKNLSQEKLNAEKLIALEKSKQQKVNAEKQRINNLLLMGFALTIITSVFIISFLKQRNQKRRAIEKVEAIQKMAALELQSLRSQLNPHFMFNSLNSLQELILLNENKKSHSYLSRFSKLLRILLENAEKPFISLRTEIEFLELYLRLETLRIPDLQYSIEIDPCINTDVTLIPNMILQPYIENALWHGLSQKQGDKQLSIKAARENGTITYEIEDNGIGRRRAKQMKTSLNGKRQSLGMELLSKRFKVLNEQYNTEIKTSVTDVLNGNEVAGTLVTVSVPVRVSLQSEVYS